MFIPVILDLATELFLGYAFVDLPLENQVLNMQKQHFLINLILAFGF